jgi:hypothetical protein
MENRSTQDGIWAWYQLVKQYKADGDKNVSIKKLENVITTVFHLHYKGGLFEWIQFKTMKMLSQNLFYLARRLGMMMRCRNVGLCKMLRILNW